MFHLEEQYLIYGVPLPQGLLGSSVMEEEEILLPRNKETLKKMQCMHQSAQGGIDGFHLLVLLEGFPIKHRIPESQTVWGGKGPLGPFGPPSAPADTNSQVLRAPNLLVPIFITWKRGSPISQQKSVVTQGKYLGLISIRECRASSHRDL